LELPVKWVVRTIERIWCKAILQLSPFKLNKNPAETEKVVQTFILLEVVMQWIVQQLHQLHPAQVNPGVSEVAASLHANIALHKGFAQVLTGTRRGKKQEKKQEVMLRITT
jgi:hypothetical protein